MGKGGAAPKAPDPYKTAAAESQFNRLDTYSPSGGGVRQGYTDANGKFVGGIAPEGSQSAQSYIESPVQRQMRQLLEPASLNLTKDTINAGLPDRAKPQDFSQVAQGIFDAGYGRMKPQFQAENNRMLANLQARGIPVGSGAFNKAYGQQQQSVNDALANLTMRSTAAAGQEQSRQYGLDTSQRRNAIAELVAAMGGGYNPPAALPSGSASPVNYSGLVGQKFNADMAKYNSDQRSGAATASALGNLGGAMLMKCSVSVKAITGGLNISRASHAIQNMPLFAWKYLEGEAPPGFADEQHVGPMAESFHALTGLGVPSTINMVDIIGVLTGALQDALQRIDMLEYKQKGGVVQ